MKKLIFNKINFVGFIVLLSIESINAQPIANVESKAVNYFFDNLSLIDKNLENAKITFKKSTEGKPSDVYTVAYNIGDINLMKDSIPNKDYLDKLEKMYSNTSSLGDKIKLNVAPQNKKKGTALTFKLHVLNAIKYKDSTFVELFLTNKRMSNRITVVIKFVQQNPASFYVKSLISD